MPERIIGIGKEKLIELYNTEDFYKDVPIELFSDFLRGFFEAEGTVSWHKTNYIRGGDIVSGFSQNDIDILEYIHFTLKHYLDIVKGGGIYPYKNAHQLHFSVNDSISLYHYMYDDCGNMFLKRKKERFEGLIGRYEE